ncbi:MAG: hypothetical protein AAB691_00215 [Patescibacteria group bacterium]
MSSLNWIGKEAVANHDKKILTSFTMSRRSFLARHIFLGGLLKEVASGGIH